MGLAKMIEQVYRGRERVIILGLTGRTGSGCSTVAKILRKKSISELDLRECKERCYSSAEERKNKVIYEYMKEEGRWSEFCTIEVSSIILAAALERGLDSFIKYIEDITTESAGEVVNIGEKFKVTNALKNVEYMFDNCKKYSLREVKIEDLKEGKLAEYYDFYMNKMKKYKNSLKSIFEQFTCYEIKRDKKRGKQQSQYHLYTYLLQRLGNNIRCSGNPFDDTFLESEQGALVQRIDAVIKIIKKNNKQYGTRICIDAIRNPYEAFFLRDKYRAFYLIAVNTEDDDRKRRLRKLNAEELINLDKVEYAQKVKKPQEIFYHQNVQSCIENADIHIYNPDISNGKYYELTAQLLKYISLALHPGLVTPTHLERCMQLAYNAKFNSGCLSRQVGAVVTREDYSIQSVGWNDVPKGQVSCNLRDVHSFCKNKDDATYSQYELEDADFSDSMERIAEQTAGKMCGRCMSFCFKDVYNGMRQDKNQVYTRALHAEENAFLQISKYGGSQVQNGCLFTTASPCELCAKKAYQLGIRKIYYIDPYPGISKTHILTFGKENEKNPEMKLFYGAIGQAYLDFYAPRIAHKDELELLTGVNVKQAVAKDKKKSMLDYKDIVYKCVENEMKFSGNRTDIESRRRIEGEIRKDGINSISKSIVWTGSSYDGTELVRAESDTDISLVEEKNSMPYVYNIVFKEPKKQGELIHYSVITKTKDEKQVMEPYFAHMVKYETQKLILRVIAPKKLIENVVSRIYADLDMKTEIKTESIKVQADENNEIYTFEIPEANVNYTYSIEWNFIE